MCSLRSERAPAPRGPTVLITGHRHHIGAHESLDRPRRRALSLARCTKCSSRTTAGQVCLSVSTIWRLWVATKPRYRLAWKDAAARANGLSVRGDRSAAVSAVATGEVARETVVWDRFPGRGRTDHERTDGRTSGSPSNVPMRTPIHSGCLSLRAKIEDPHMLQNHFSPPSSGFQHLRTSSPATMRKESTTA